MISVFASLVNVMVERKATSGNGPRPARTQATAASGTAPAGPPHPPRSRTPARRWSRSGPHPGAVTRIDRRAHRAARASKSRRKTSTCRGSTPNVGFVPQSSALGIVAPRAPRHPRRSLDPAAAAWARSKVRRRVSEAAAPAVTGDDLAVEHEPSAESGERPLEIAHGSASRIEVDDTTRRRAPRGDRLHVSPNGAPRSGASASSLAP